MAFHLRAATPDDFAFAFAAKRDAMGPHIQAHWGWDDNLQLRLHRERWEKKAWHVILAGNEAVGTVSMDFFPTHLQFGEFYIVGPHRRHGLGTQVLLHALGLADENGVESRVECLKWNPAISLYARNGFLVVGENDIHRFLVRPVHTPDDASRAS